MAGVDEPPRGHDIPKQKELLVKDSRKESRSTRRRRLQIIRSEGESSAAGKYTPDHKHATYQKRSSVSDAEMRPCLSHGSASIIGRRREMEDAVKEAPGFASADSGTGGTLPPVAYDFFGVYDGHCGASVASACRDRLHVVLAEEVAALGGWPRTEEQWKEVMAACFTRMDGETEAMAEAGVGSTALVAVVGAEHIVVANCGDSRAVLSRGGVAVPLSSDHKPDRPDEMERVEAAGGRVVKWDAYRVEGVLATSRSIGIDFLTTMNLHRLKPFVISEPEVTVTSRTEEDELLILACDGLWDVVSSEMACRLARKCLGGQLAKRFPLLVTDCSAAEAAVCLAELAYAGENIRSTHTANSGKVHYSLQKTRMLDDLVTIMLGDGKPKQRTFTHMLLEYIKPSLVHLLSCQERSYQIVFTRANPEKRYK